MIKKSKKLNHNLRAPIVVVLGHVDHGKTSILDYIRKTKITAKESGNITQHIGAYEIKYNGKKITFVDTPGHEAFSAMRLHGSKIADVAIIVIAVNDGIKPQTKEAIKLVKEQNIPYMVVLNKIDLIDDNASINKIEKQLQSVDVQLESWGGEIPFLKTSTKTGEGIEDLLEMVLIMGEMAIHDNKEDIKNDDFSSMIVVETRICDRSGIEAVVLIKNGEFKKGDMVISSNNVSFKIKKMLDWVGSEIKTAYTSQPITIFGFKYQPSIGEIFTITKNQKVLNTGINYEHIGANVVTYGGADKEEIKLIVKFDVLGSYDALKKVLKIIANDLDIKITIIGRGLGSISESDLKLAQSDNTFILGFRVKTPNLVKTTADRLKIKIITYDIIYNIKKGIETFLEKNIEKKREIRGQLLVLAVFKKRLIEDKKKRIHRIILGGKVTEGKIKKNNAIDILRKGNIVGFGKIIEIEQDRKPTNSVEGEQECGLLYEGNIEIKKGDIIQDIIR